jgi:hypothetical protein
MKEVETEIAVPKKGKPKGKSSMNLKEAKKEISSAQRLHETELNLKKMETQIQQITSILRELVLKMGNMQQNENRITFALQDLGKKVDTMVGVLDSSNVLSKKLVDDAITTRKVGELVEKTEQLKANGVIVPTDVVGDISFLVIEERSSSGELVSPRTQCLLGSLSEENRSKLLGAKVGDSISLGEGKNTVTIMELYNIVEKNETVSEEEIAQMEQEDSAEA